MYIYLFTQTNTAMKRHQQTQAALAYITLYKMHSAGFSPVCTLKCFVIPNGISNKLYTNDSRWLLARVHYRMPYKNTYHPRVKAANSSVAYNLLKVHYNQAEAQQTHQIQQQ